MQAMSNDMYQIISASESETESIGRLIGEVIQSGDALLLQGEMGAGKTCLTRGIAQGAECEVSARSPTFIILAEYPGRVRIFHCDLYRITGSSEAQELALDETLERGALVVEWPENADGELPQDALHVKIDPGASTDHREISFSPSGVGSTALLERLASSRKGVDQT